MGVGMTRYCFNFPLAEVWTRRRSNCIICPCKGLFWWLPEQWSLNIELPKYVCRCRRRQGLGPWRERIGSIIGLIIPRDTAVKTLKIVNKKVRERYKLRNGTGMDWATVARPFVLTWRRYWLYEQSDMDEVNPSDGTAHRHSIWGIRLLYMYVERSSSFQPEYYGEKSTVLLCRCVKLRSKSVCYCGSQRNL